MYVKGDVFFSSLGPCGRGSDSGQPDGSGGHGAADGVAREGVGAGAARPRPRKRVRAALFEDKR